MKYSAVFKNGYFSHYSWIKVGKRTRRALLKRFPYFILYIFEEETVPITWIANQHRDLEYYINRIV